MKRIVKLPRKLLSIFLALTLVMSSVLISGNVVFAEGEKVDVSISVNDTAEEPLEDVKVTIYSDSSMDSSFKLDSYKTDEYGKVSFSLDEIDIYYYLVEADDMKSVSGSLTKTSPEATITMNYVVDCHTCNGTGKVECTTCHGTGKQTDAVSCINCAGTGKVDSEVECDICNGTGTVYDSETSTDITCENCSGTGKVLEKVDCSTCDGKGNIETEVNCSTCNGTKKIDCSDCEGTGKHEAYDDFEFKFNINPSLKYLDSVNNPVIVAKSQGTITYSSDNSNIDVDSNGKISGNRYAKAGDTATITAKIAFDKTNGYAPKKANCTVTVVKQDFATDINTNNLTYNGTNQSLVTIENASEYQSITYSGENISEDGKAKDAGTYSVTVTVIKDSNYIPYSRTVSVTIDKAELTINPTPGQTKEYGDVPNIDYEIEGGFNGEVTKNCFTGGFTYEGYGTEAGDAAGDNLIVPTSNFGLDDSVESNKNYTLPSANINPNHTTIKVNDIQEGVPVSLPEGYYLNEKTNEIWYNNSYFSGETTAVVINAPEGYQISKTKNYSDFNDSVSFSNEQDCQEVKLYLREVIVDTSSDWDLISKLIDWGAYQLDKTFGKTTYTMVKFGIDKTLPTMDHVTFDTENDNLFAAIGRTLTFGSFFKKQIVAKVESSDDRSGVDKVVIKYDALSSEFTSANNQDFIISSDDTVEGQFFVRVTDNAGNINSVANSLATSTNSNIADSDSPVIMIENNAPIITSIETIAEGRDSVFTVNGKKVFSDDVSFKFSLSDTESSLFYTEISVNGTKLDKYQYFYGDKTTKTPNASYEVKTSDFEALEDNGEYTIEVHYSDAAGNDDTTTETIYVDRHAPIVKSFEINGIVGTKDDNEIPHSVEATSYGFYFQNSANVEVTFGDYAEKNEYLSGIKSVKIYLVDKDNGNIYEITSDGEMKQVEAISDVTAIPASKLKNVEDDTNDIKKFSFTVDKNFKGQIYAKAYDNVENDLTNNYSPEKADDIIGQTLSFDSNGYQKPNGSIIESVEKHESQDNPHIVIEPITKVVGKDNAGRDLYSTDVDVEVTVADTYSGIKSVKLSVSADYDTGKNYSHLLTIGTDAKAENAIVYSGDENENDWNIDSTDQNIANIISNTIKVSNDSNDIIITVELTDRAGNTSVENINFSIDKTKPIITVEYDNNSVQNGKYYQDSRTATITIKELNFTEEHVEKSVYRISDDNVVITEILDGKNQNVEPTFTKSELKTITSEDGVTTAYYEYTKKIICSIQGDYLLTLTAMDNALNKADYNRKDEFSVDTQTPYIEVKFDPEEDSTATTGYFSNQRKATITVTDRYFDASKTSILVKADDNGKMIDAPSPTKWSDQTADYKQSCEVTFKVDGTYSFTVDSTDLSGKEATQYKVGDFTIDNTDPTIKVYINKEEVKNNDKLAFIDEVVPQVVVEDTNFSAADTKVTLVAAVPKEETNLDNQQTPISKDSEKKCENGMTYDYKNFDDEDGKSRKYDNIYTLTVETKDKAGRKIDPVTIQFSVNRFGSNYIDYETVVGKYFSSAPVIQVTEVNVNPLNLDDEETFVEVVSNSGETQHLKTKDVIIQTLEAGEKNWYEYHYAIPSKCFGVDDFYSIKLSSVDTAKRHSTNVNSEINDDEIYFTVDTTKPYYEVTNYKENDDSVHEDNFVLNLKLLDDTSGIQRYEVKFDGEVYKTVNKEKGFDNTVELNIPIKGAEKLADASGRILEITVYDAAENNISGEKFSVRISTNFWVNALAKLQDFYHNTPAFWGTVAGVFVVASGLIWFVIAKKRKNNSNTAV